MLRSAGILDLLAGSKSAEDPDYKKFVDESGFDYCTALDRLAIGFRPTVTKPSPCKAAFIGTGCPNTPSHMAASARTICAACPPASLAARFRFIR